MVTQQILPYLQKLTGLKDLKISNRVLEDVAYSCDGQTDYSELKLLQVDKVAVEHENSVQVKHCPKSIGYMPTDHISAPRKETRDSRKVSF